MTSYHNHTLFSDGTATAADMVTAAQQAGLGEVGISDHIVIHPQGRTFKWGMPLNRLEEYVAAVREAGRNAHIPVRLGIEADFFEETADQLRELLGRYPFDYVIGSVHFAGGFMVDESRKKWEDLSPLQRDEKWSAYWGGIAGLARSGIFDFVAHLDLPKRFGFAMEENTSRAALAALDAVARAGMAIEINTSGWSHPVKEAYPSPALLQAAWQRKIEILVNADAHNPRDIDRFFGPAKLLAREAGYTQTVRFAGRKRSRTPL
ncbi:MAG TPA: histidinol-phosphatase [Elusimicrobia bacterium]|nr:histidinol-phosphatase [Elusimicrobiota bacterium]HBT61159.1 histidinol-phosphatase [Elusimicrobiota bacterium]